MLRTQKLQKHFNDASRLLEDLAALKEKPAELTSFNGRQDVDTAIARAVQFLEREFYIANSWSDFARIAAGGRDWITAYVAAALLLTQMANPDVIRRAARCLEKDRYDSGGWGYRPGIPTDADSSCWATAFLSASEYPINLSQSINVILAHQCPDGGFRTYLPDSGIRQFIEADEHEDLLGWCSSHLCVTGAAVRALFIAGIPSNSTAIQSALNFIRERQTEGGYWNSYWFHGKAYGTAHAIQALRLMGDDNDIPRLIRAKEWLENNQATNGSWQDNGSSNAFETALTICALLGTPSPPLPNIWHGVGWLLQQQRQDGSWASQPILQVPATSEQAPWERRNWTKQGLTGILVADHNRVFTTATVLKGLIGWRKQEQAGGD